MAAVTVNNPYGALTLSVQVMGAAETQTQLAAGAVVVGFLDEYNRGKKFNPWEWGYAPQTGDAANKWLPTVGTVTAFTSTDGTSQTGAYRVTLIPGSSDLVNVASVQTVTIDRNALVIVATGTF